MNKLKISFFIMIYLLLASFAVMGFKPFAKDALTYTELAQNPEKTIEKYANIWEDRTIIEKPYYEKNFESGDCVGTITIPRMNYYEMPIYYGADHINNNWQITTMGHLGNWDMFGENGRAAVGAHNYQLFSNLPDMQKGDLFLIETDEDIFIYEVIGSRVYDHLTDDWYQVAYLDALPYSVNLMTCWPIEQGMEATEDTYIVYSKMVHGIKYINQ